MSRREGTKLKRKNEMPRLSVTFQVPLRPCQSAGTRGKEDGRMILRVLLLCKSNGREDDSIQHEDRSQERVETSSPVLRA